RHVTFVACRLAPFPTRASLVRAESPAARRRGGEYSRLQCVTHRSGAECHLPTPKRHLERVRDGRKTRQAPRREQQSWRFGAIRPEATCDSSGGITKPWPGLTRERLDA